MPRGEHPNSRANLKPFEKGLPEKHQREIQQKGVEKASQVRSLNADLREQCSDEVIEEINKRIINMAKKGNLKAYELIRDGLGEKPNDKVDLSILEDESARKAREYFADQYNKGIEE